MTNHFRASRMLVPVLIGLLLPGAVLAHEGASLPYGSFLAGLTHPVLGLDHFLAELRLG